MGTPTDHHRVSFRLGTKRKGTSQFYEPSQPPAANAVSTPNDEKFYPTVKTKQGSRASTERTESEGIKTAAEASSQKSTHSNDLSTTRPTSAIQSDHMSILSTRDMAEPPAKRSKRTDSSAMWERNSSRPTDIEHKHSVSKELSNGRDHRDHRDRHHGRDDVKRRSRSRDRKEKRRDRTRSRERDSRRYRNGEKNGEWNGERDRRDRERSTSRERHRSRRGE